MSQEIHFYEVFYFSNRFSNEIYKSLTANNIRENLIIWEATLTMYNSVNWQTLFTGIDDKFYLGFQNISHQLSAVLFRATTTHVNVNTMDLHNMVSNIL